MATRVVHRVRCRHDKDSQIWADVKVIDAFTIIGPDGQEMLYWTKAKDALPFILDGTGDGNGVGNGSGCTRASHMVQVSDPDDDKQIMDIEVLDALSFVPSNVTEADSADREADAENQRGMDKAARFGKGPFSLIMPDKLAIKQIVDKTGLGLSAGGSLVSRSGHVSLVTEKGNTDDKTDGLKDAGDSVPPKKLAWCAVVKLDAINFSVPGGNISIIMPKRDADEVDTTKMTTDPVTHDPCPPDNTDPNHYVKFPDKSIGASVKIPKGQPSGTGPIQQGALWWIEQISPTFRPWFWYATINEPRAFSFFAAPGDLGSWPWRGFMFWNSYPVIWILSRNNAITSMGIFGSSSLEKCAEGGDWDSSYPPTPSNEFLAPPRTSGTVAFPFSGLSFVPSDLLTAVVRPQSKFGPFGGLPMTQPKLAQALNTGLPNVWQLTGRTQPPLKDPSKPWDPFNNPYTPPSRKDAEDLAHDYAARWNAAANGHNSFITGYSPGGRGGTYGQEGPPGWSWAIPYFNNLIPANRFAFQNGIPPGFATAQGLPIVTYAPATSWTMAVDTLDPKIWDDTHLEYYNNPLNAFFTSILPPFPWANDPWTGTGAGPSTPFQGD